MAGTWKRLTIPVKVLQKWKMLNRPLFQISDVLQPATGCNRVRVALNKSIPLAAEARRTFMPIKNNSGRSNNNPIDPFMKYDSLYNSYRDYQRSCIRKGIHSLNSNTETPFSRPSIGHNANKPNLYGSFSKISVSKPTRQYPLLTISHNMVNVDRQGLQVRPSCAFTACQCEKFANDDFKLMHISELHNKRKLSQLSKDKTKNTHKLGKHDVQKGLAELEKPQNGMRLFKNWTPPTQPVAGKLKKAETPKTSRANKVAKPEPKSRKKEEGDDNDNDDDYFEISLSNDIKEDFNPSLEGLRAELMPIKKKAPYNRNSFRRFFNPVKHVTPKYRLDSMTYYNNKYPQLKYKR